MRSFNGLFALAVVLGALGSASYFVTAIRIARAGSSVKFMAYPQDVLRILQQYCVMAEERGWSLWPVYAFWVLSIPAVCAVVLCFFFFDAKGPHGSKLVIPSVGLSLVWASLSSFLIAIVFSIRIYYRGSETKANQGGLKWLLRNKDNRNDFYLAFLGWAGFLLALFILAIKQMFHH